MKEVIRYLFEDVRLDVIFCGHFVFNQRSAHLQEKLGYSEQLAQLTLYRGGLQIYTTLNPEIQAKMDELVPGYSLHFVDLSQYPKLREGIR